VSSQVHWAAAIAAKSPLYKADAGTALVAEATRVAAAGGEGDEGRGPLQEDASVALVALALVQPPPTVKKKGELV
jgi:hypothetical protein